jgi:hypothetical protein
MTHLRRRDVLAWLSASAVLPALARRARAAESVDGKWEGLTINPVDQDRYAPDKKQRAEFVTHVEAFIAVLRSHPSWSSPKGFDVRPHLMWGSGGIWDRPPAPIAAILMIQTFWYGRDGRTGGLSVGDESSLSLFVNFNSPESIFDRQHFEMAREPAAGLYWEPTAQPTKSPVPRFDTGHVVARRTAPLFVPVTRKRLLEAWLAEARHDLRNEPHQARAAADTARLERELAAMSATDAAEPAYCEGRYWRKLARRGDEGARAVAAANPAFFDASLPRSALQLAIVRHPSKGMSKDPDLLRVFEKLEGQRWEKLLELMA